MKNEEIAGAEEAKKTPIDELFRKLSSSENGLSRSEAEKRLQEHGYNEIPEKKRSSIVRFLGYFWGANPMDD